MGAARDMMLSQTQLQDLLVCQALQSSCMGAQEKSTYRQTYTVPAVFKSRRDAQVKCDLLQCSVKPSYHT